jgi:hypothetical protein
MQNALFHDRIEDAADEVCRAVGGRKKMACELWPDKATRDAHNLLDACLNQERREHLTPSQLLYIARRGREVGCHAVMMFLDQDCGYASTPVTKCEEVDRVTSVIAESTKTLATALATLERLQHTA